MYSRMQVRDICKSRLRSDDAFHFVAERLPTFPMRVTAILWNPLERFLGQVAAGM